jgi:hypothetical protein
MRIVLITLKPRMIGPKILLCINSTHLEIQPTREKSIVSHLFIIDISYYTYFYRFRQTIKKLIVLTPEIDCDQTAMGLPAVTSAFLIAK